VRQIFRIYCASNRHGNRGFSLVELIVVIGIIAVLASIISSAVSNGARQARCADCANNLHQLGLAFNLYTQDDNCFPLATQDGITGAWQNSLQTTAPGLQFYCPSPVIPTTSFCQIFNWKGGAVLPSYGYNVQGAAWRGDPPYNPGLGGDVDLANGKRMPTGVNRVVRPSQMIMTGDSPTFLELVLKLRKPRL
jgi:prepilin-type N-terminal cleavage/methylation domain-containing protein